MSASLIPEHPILLVDDEEQALQSYDLNLRYSGLTNTIRCSDPRQVADILGAREVSVIMLDLSMPGMHGEDVLRFVRGKYPHVPVIIVTGFNEVETAVRCMRAGSVDYLVKPVDRAHLLSAVRHALESRTVGGAPAPPGAAQAQPPPENPVSSIVTASPLMESALAYARAVAASDEPVLLTGETGVGKELFAKAIHELSGRKGKFVAVNVAGLDDVMFSDTLFGHKKGAYTGASLGRRGLIEESQEGSLFLDEIGDLARSSQLKLLRLIQEREYYPLGSDSLKPMRSRLIVATNQALERRMDEGQFRRDLFFRLRTHLVAIPPLRERTGDLPLLTRHFLEKAAARLGKETSGIPPGLLDVLASHDFPGNVRELEAMVFNAVAVCESGVISLEPFITWIGSVRARSLPTLFPAVLPDGAQDIPTLKQAEEQAIAQALKQAGGSQSQAARLLGISRQALNKRLLLKKRQEEQ